MPPRTRLPGLLPAPVHAEPRPGGLRLTTGLPVWLPAARDDGAWHAARRLQAGVLHRCGRHLALDSTAAPSRRGVGITLTLDPSQAPALPPARAAQAYTLEVTAEGARLTGASDRALRHGVETLLQLVDPRGALPGCLIRDWPSIARRGLSLDISRGKVPSQAELFRLVSLCAQLKLDCLLLYTEHTFRFPAHPGIGADAAPLTAETLRALDRHAAEHQVELIPCLQSLGHMEHVLKLPRYAKLAESELRWSLCPTDPGTYALLGDLYDAYLPNFQSGYLHANCDEPWDLGEGRSASRAQSIGKDGLYLEHLERVQGLARAHGKRTMIWGDVLRAHPGLLERLDPATVVCDWWYEAEGDFDRAATVTARGLELWVCPGTSSWNALYPRIPNAVANITAWAEAGRRHGAHGLLVTDWGDFGHYNLFGGSMLPLAWAAQQAWSGDRDPREFDRAFGRVLFDEPRGESARAMRALGAVHDPGCQIPNGSPLAFLFFEGLETGTFARRTRPSALKRAAARVEKAGARIAALEGRMGGGDGSRTWRELRFAHDATRLALRKAELALQYHAWLDSPSSLRARARRHLAVELRELAAEQRALGKTLRRLWRARSEPEGFRYTERRLRTSLRGLTAAARRLERNHPRAAPPLAPLTLKQVVAEVREAMDPL